MDVDSSFTGQFSPLPSITIIIPTLNEGKYISQTLQQLHDQTYPKNRMEIIVVDGGSTDSTFDIVSQWINKSNLNIKVFQNTKRISSCARNIGISVAQGEYVLFIDAHVFIPSSQLIENMVRAAHYHNALVLGRPQPLNPPALSLFQSVVANVRGSKFGHSTRSFIYSDAEGWVSPVSVGVMYHISLFDKVGCFDESFDAAEDVDFNFRLEQEGYEAYISPDFKVLYYPRKNIAGLVKQMFRYGLGRARFTNKHIGGLQFEILLPVFALMILLVIGSMALYSHMHTLCMTLCVIGYFSLVFLFYETFDKVKELLLAPFVLLSIYIGLALGILAGLIECCNKKFYKRRESCNE